MVTDEIPNLRKPKFIAVLRGVTLLLLTAFAVTGCGSGSGGSTGTQSPTIQVTSHSVTLSWVADTSAVSGYAVYRSTGDSTGPFYPLAITLPGVTQYVDSSVSTGQTYYYTITAFDTANLQSFPTLAVTASIPSN
jgi:fibronectin type 3 domain-containing protein